MILEKLREIVTDEGVVINDDTLMLIARESEGSMRDAQSLLDQTISYGGKEIKEEDVLTLLGIADRKVLFDFSRAIIEGDTKKCLYLVDELYKLGYNLEQFCRDLLNHFRNLLVVKIEGGESPTLNVPQHEVKDLLDQVVGVSFEDLHRWFQILLRGEALMSRSPFPKAIMEMTLVEMARAKSMLPVEEILTRIERIEGSLAQGAEREERVLVGPPQERELKRVKEEFIQESPHTQKQEEVVSEAELGVWNDFLKFLRGENPIMASFLQHGRPLFIDDASVEIGFEKGSFALDRVSEPDTLKSLEELSQRYFKKVMRLKITTAERIHKPKKESKRMAQSEETDLARHLKSEALDNPIVKETVEIFKGKIVEVKTQEGS